MSLFDFFRRSPSPSSPPSRGGDSSFNNPSPLRGEGKGEGDSLWNDFRKAEECWGCKLFAELNQQGAGHVILTNNLTGEIASMKINYCPRCGKILRQAQDDKRNE